MPTSQPNLWPQLTPEQQARIISALLQMVLRRLSPQEVAHDRH